MQEKEKTPQEKSWLEHPNHSWNPIFWTFEHYFMNIHVLHEETGIPLEELEAMADKPRNWHYLFEGTEQETMVAEQISDYLLLIIMGAPQKIVHDCEKWVRETYGDQTIDDIRNGVRADQEVRMLLKSNNLSVLPSEEDIIKNVQQTVETEGNKIQKETSYNANLANPRYARKISKSVIAELKKLGVLKI